MKSKHKTSIILSHSYSTRVNIPFLSFDKTNEEIGSEMMEAFQQFFDSKWYILGKLLKRFEQEYATFNQTKHCIGVSNGLDALHLSLKALGIGPGDEVIVPSHTFIASVLAISFTGATPIFVEPKIDTYNINPALIEAAITQKTKAIMPVHIYGQACEMDQIMAIAEKYNIPVVEDNAQAQGATYNNQITGSFGAINGVSFYPGKNLGALGDAGAITTDNENLADKVKALRNYGSSKKYYNDVVGFNMRMDECQAAFLSVKLKYLEKWNAERQKVAEWYNQHLANLEQIHLPKIHPNSTSVYHLFVIRTGKRDELQAYLKANGIGTLIHYPVPVHLQKAYQNLGHIKGDFPLAEELAETCLSLPIFIGIAEDQVVHICNQIKSFFLGN